MAIAMTFALLGVGIFFATNNPFSMLSLSDQYAAATTNAQRSTILAAGQAVLANCQYEPTRRRWFQHSPLPGVRCGSDSLIGHVPEQFLQQDNRLCGNSGPWTVISRLSQTGSDVIGHYRPARDSSECPVRSHMVHLSRPEALPARASRRKDASPTIVIRIGRLIAWCAVQLLLQLTRLSPRLDHAALGELERVGDGFRARAAIIAHFDCDQPSTAQTTLRIKQAIRSSTWN